MTMVGIIIIGSRILYPKSLIKFGCTYSIFNQPYQISGLIKRLARVLYASAAETTILYDEFSGTLQCSVYIIVAKFSFLPFQPNILLLSYCQDASVLIILIICCKIIYHFSRLFLYFISIHKFYSAVSQINIIGCFLNISVQLSLCSCNMSLLWFLINLKIRLYMR